MKLFLRFSSNEYLTRFQQEGHLYCNSIQCFSEYKDDIGRGDEYENIFEQHYLPAGTVTFKAEGAPDSELVKGTVEYQIVKMISTKHFVNIFCLYSINLGNYNINEQIIISNEIKKMGTHCLVIFDVNEFASRVEKAIIKIGNDYKFDYIKYVDYSKFSGKKNVFQKPIEFEFQNEYRIAIANDSKSPIELFIGSIEDISGIYPVSKLNIITFGDKTLTH